MTKLLNHGHIKLVDSTGNDLSIVRSARVSQDAEWRAGENSGSDKKLIKYLWKNKHSTPFESVTVTFDIKAPIFVLRQWHRHRTMSYNEVSARYSELPEEFYVPELEQITTQSKDNKQMKTDNVHPEAWMFRGSMIAQNSESFTIYKRMIKDGCPRELARTILPVATYSHMFATANLLNWFKFISLRLHPHAQYEIRVYAQEILKMLKDVTPIATEIFEEELKI